MQPAVLPRAVSVALFLILASAAGAEAGVSPFWRPLGTSATGNGVSQTLSPRMVLDGSLAVGGDGRPVVAYTEYANAVAAQGAITVKRWTGSAWQTLSGAGGIGQGYLPQVRVSQTGAIVVAWLTDDAAGNTEIRLLVRSGSTFAPLGGSNSPGGLSGAHPGITAPFSLALAANGHPVVAFLATALTGIIEVPVAPAVVEDTAQVYVRRWSGTAWEFVGSDFTGGGASQAVSFVNGRGQAVLHIADTPSVAIGSDGDPAVAFTYFTAVDGVPAANTDVYVVRWDGGDWRPVGPAVPSGDTPAGNGQAGGVSNSITGSFNPWLAPAEAGRLALAWEEDAPGGATYVWVRVWNGADTWEQLAGSASGSGIVPPDTVNVLPQIAVDPEDRPVVAWQALGDFTAPAQIFVRRWNGLDAWEELGPDSVGNVGISDALVDAQAPSLALTPQGGTAVAGTPTVAWLDTRESGSFQVFLRQFFTGPTVALTLRLVGDGSVTSTPVGVDCAQPTCVTEFPAGTVVRLHPAGGADTLFGSWAGACTGAGGCTVTLSAPRSVNASFVAAATLAVEVLGSGGRVTSSPAGIAACTGACSAKFREGTKVTLTAAVNTGGRFLGWGDACAFRGTNSTCAVTLAANTSVTTTFDLIPYTVTVTQRPNGTVANLNGLPDGVTCGAGGTDCVATLDFGTPVVLRATPVAGSRFLNWTGGACNGLKNQTCSFTIPSRNISLTPNFRDVTALSLDKSGLGTINSSPAGIRCGLTCTEATFDFARGALVRLSPAPAVGWRFDGFSGDCTGATCLVNASTISAFVGASFTIQQRRLSVTVVGSGSVGGSGFLCNPSTTPCTQDFDYGTLLPLTPVAAAGHRFTGWSQGCSGSNPATCRPLLTANRSITATFRPVFTMAVTRTGNSPSGTITSSPAGIRCGGAASDCSETYLGGTRVTLVRSAPTTGSLFQWLGDCAFRGTNASCALPMTANHSVTGEYRLQPLGLRVNKIGPASGTVTRVGGSLACGPTCSEVVSYGTPVTLLATPAANPASEFVSWTGCTPATNLSCSFPLTANRTVTATFRPLATEVTLHSLTTGPIGVGGSRQLTALAAFTDGSVDDVTGQTATTTWTVTPTGVVRVSSTGVVTGVAPGNASVQATFRRGTQQIVSAPLVIDVDRLINDVDAPTGRAITVTCSPYADAGGPLTCLPSGLNFEVHCRAFGRFVTAPDTPADITDQVTWVTTSTAVARATGLVAFQGPQIQQSFRIAGPGTARLYARQGTRTSLTTGTAGTDPWAVEAVALGQPASLQIQPSAPEVSAGRTVQLRARVTFAGTATCPVAPPRDFSLLVDWSSDDETVADVSFFGQVSGRRSGQADISATYVRIVPMSPLTATVPLDVNP